MNYKTVQFESLVMFAESDLIKHIDSSTLMIIDIDGVFFPRIFMLQTIRGIVSQNTVHAFSQLVEKAGNTWIFTDRPFWTSRFPFVQTLRKILGRGVITYRNSQEFLNADDLFSNAIIFNAKKTSIPSQEVVLAAVGNHKSVFYIAAQDFSWVYKDKTLLDETLNKKDLGNLFFIDIKHAQSKV